MIDSMIVCNVDIPECSGERQLREAWSRGSTHACGHAALAAPLCQQPQEHGFHSSTSVDTEKKQPRQSTRIGSTMS